MSVISPNMGLVVSAIGVDSGLNWETNLNASLSTIDQHNHTSGQGVQIPPAGLNISSDLTFQINNATNLRSIRFYPQSAPLALSTDLGCLYESGVDLYYNDGNGTQIRLTNSGSPSSAVSSIVSGTNTAGFVSNVLVVNAATSTPANIQGASILLGNNVSGSNYLTLSPPNSLASNYGLVLPSVPASLSFMTLDSSGNMGTASSVSGSQIASGSITGSQLANSTVTGSKIANTTIAAGNIISGTITSTQISTNTLNNGTYTPTVSSSTFSTASALTCQWLQVGNTVTVSGFLAVSYTGPTTNYACRITLPVTNGNFSGNNQGAGTGFGTNSGFLAGLNAISGTGQMAIALFTPGGFTETEDIAFNFSYLVL